MTAFRTIPHNTTGTIPGFDVDGPLGRLAKWLRIVGLDAAYPLGKPDSRRFFVTARARVVGLTVIHVSDRTVFGQVSQVITAAGLRVDRKRFFSRCLICNVAVEEVPGDRALESVPTEVAARVSEFTWCPRCRRVYWEGTHLKRVVSRLADAGLVLDDGSSG